MALAVLLGLAGSGGLVCGATEAAFTGQTDNPGNSWATGSVVLADNDSADTLINVSNVMPGDSGTKCITVSYTGTILSRIKLYTSAPSGSAALADELDLVISTSPVASAVADPNCNNSYTWTQVWTGTLSGLEAYAGYADAVPVPDWNTGAGTEHQAYRIQYNFRPSTDVDGLLTSASLTWEARNA